MRHDPSARRRNGCRQPKEVARPTSAPGGICSERAKVEKCGNSYHLEIWKFQSLEIFSWRWLQLQSLKLKIYGAIMPADWSKNRKEHHDENLWTESAKKSDMDENNWIETSKFCVLAGFAVSANKFKQTWFSTVFLTCSKLPQHGISLMFKPVFDAGFQPTNQDVWRKLCKCIDRNKDHTRQCLTKAPQLRSQYKWLGGETWLENLWCNQATSQKRKTLSYTQAIIEPKRPRMRPLCIDKMGGKNTMFTFSWSASKKCFTQSHMFHQTMKTRNTTVEENSSRNESCWKLVSLKNQTSLNRDNEWS